MEVLEQILAVDDFVSFKKMMVKRNMELELEAMKALQSLSARIAEEGSGSGGEQEEPGDDDFEAQLQQALELSMKEAQAAGTSTGINSADVDRQQAEAEAPPPVEWTVWGWSLRGPTLWYPGRSPKGSGRPYTRPRA